MIKHLFFGVVLAFCIEGKCDFEGVHPSFFIASSVENDSQVIYPISDSKELKLPRNLRLSSDINYGKSVLNIEGLNHLRMSGSAQFSEETFKGLIQSLSHLPEKMIVVDLREESHGFINGLPISWTEGKNYVNVNKRREEIEQDERNRLNQAFEEKQIVIDPFGKATTLTVQKVQTEQELVEGYGATYVRLPVTDHYRPSDAVVDQLLMLKQNIASDGWLYFHCRGGRGRTTTFLILLDILENSSHVSLEDIIFRQYLIGGSDLFHVDKKDPLRAAYAVERLAFIKEFYLYCQEVPDHRISWSEWVLSNSHCLSDSIF